MCGGAGYGDEIRIDGTPIVEVGATGVVGYHLTRTTPDGDDVIDFEGRFVTRRRFEGVLHVQFGGSPTAGPSCATLWIGVTA